MHNYWTKRAWKSIWMMKTMLMTVRKRRTGWTMFSLWLIWCLRRLRNLKWKGWRKRFNYAPNTNYHQNETIIAQKFAGSAPRKRIIKSRKLTKMNLMSTSNFTWLHVNRDSNTHKKTLKLLTLRTWPGRYLLALHASAAISKKSAPQIWFERS